MQRRAGYEADRRGFMLSHKVAPRADVERAHQVYHWLTMVAETVGAKGAAEAYHLDVNVQSRWPGSPPDDVVQHIAGRFAHEAWRLRQPNRRQPRQRCRAARCKSSLPRCAARRPPARIGPG